MRADEFIIENTISIKSDKQAHVKAWIEDVYSKFPRSPLNPRQRIMTWGEGDDMEFAMFELAPGMIADTAEIDWIQSYPQGAGVGTRAIGVLQDLARNAGISLSLYPWDKGKISQRKLMKFYGNRGFKPVSAGAKNMIWRPD